MRNFTKSAALGAAILTAGAMTAYADPVGRADTAGAQTQISALPPSTPAAVPVLQLPPVNVYPPTDQRSPYYDPYTSGLGPRPSSLNNIPFTHFEVPSGYDADVTMHPYTSGLGPCTEGASPSQGCHHDTGAPIRPSHYNNMAWFK